MNVLQAAAPERLKCGYYFFAQCGRMIIIIFNVLCFLRIRADFKTGILQIVKKSLRSNRRVLR